MPDNVRRGRPQGKCNREQTAWASAQVRVKGWSKSPPRGWQHPRHGKPHREQSRIGTASGNRDPVSGFAVRVGCLRRRAIAVPEEWPPRGLSCESKEMPALQNPAYRPADACVRGLGGIPAGPSPVSDGCRYNRTSLGRNKVSFTQIIFRFLLQGKSYVVVSKRFFENCPFRLHVASAPSLAETFSPVSLQPRLTGREDALDTARSLNALAVCTVFVFLGAVLLGMF